jgi:hypothetical protein
MNQKTGKKIWLIERYTEHPVSAAIKQVKNASGATLSEIVRISASPKSDSYADLFLISIDSKVLDLQKREE